MVLKSLKLSNFRCYESLEIDFHKRLTLLVGKNGSGKSTILDAERLLSELFWLRWMVCQIMGSQKRMLVMFAFHWEVRLMCNHSIPFL